MPRCLSELMSAVNIRAPHWVKIASFNRPTDTYEARSETLVLRRRTFVGWIGAPIRLKLRLW